MMKKTILLTSVLFCFAVGVRPQDCAPIPVAVSRYLDSDAVAIYNPAAHNSLVLWHRMIDVDLFTTSDTVNGRIISGIGALSPSRNYSFGGNQGRMASGSLSAAFNTRSQEYFVAWFEIPESGLNHSDGLYFRRIDPEGNALGPVQKVASHDMFQPRIAYVPSQDQYLLAYGEGVLKAVSVARLTSSGQMLGSPSTFGSSPNSLNELNDIVPISDSTDSILFWTRSVFIDVAGSRLNTLMAQRVDSEANLVGSSHKVGQYGTFSFGNPCAVYNPARKEFLALIAGKLIGPVVSQFQVMRLGMGATALEAPHVVGTVDSNFPPAVAYNSRTGRYGLFYIRNDSLYFHELGPLGKPFGPERLISCTKRTRSGPGLLFDSGSGKYFAYWTHANPRTGYDIYADEITPLP